MTAPQVMAHLITTSASVTSALAGGALHIVDADEGAALPFLTLEVVNRNERRTVGRTEAKVMTNSRMRVTAVAKTYPEVKALHAAVRAACSNKIGTIDGVTGVSTRADAAGQDQRDVQRGVYAQHQDFIVFCHEPGNPVS